MLKWLRGIDWAEIGASALVLVTILLIVQKLPPPNQSISGAHKLTSEIVSSSPADERLADYTLGLEIFTGALVAVGLLQILLLFKSDKTARQMARAAMKQTVIARRQMLIQGAQADIFTKQKEIQRLQVLALHRPRLIVREVYWNPDNRNAISLIVVNQGVNQARIVECRFEFERDDERPILPNGENVLDEMAIGGGEFAPITVDLSEGYPFFLGAFQEGLLMEAKFQGVMIYADEVGNKYRLVFKRICARGAGAFRRTANPDDEYSD